MKLIVWITTEFEAFHRWEKAPEETAFLRHWHRHVFKVRIGKNVDHCDRAIEFFAFKKQVNQFINEKYTGKKFELSCEQLALEMLNHFGAAFVEVSEDGENGAIVSED